ncbi:MAG: 4-hydroxy-tetrahydrodipicolinate reductase [Steroidobacteraceae bacterium]
MATHAPAEGDRTPAEGHRTHGEGHRMLRLALIGAAGRMGRSLVHAARDRSDITVQAGVVSPSSELAGRDLGEVAGVGELGVELSADLPAGLAACDVALDFSHPLASAANLAACCAVGRPLLIGTTGIRADVQHELERAAKHIALLVAPNTSLGITLLIELARQCACALPAHFDIEIIEAHHRHKRDAPSGTALALGNAVAEVRGVAIDPAGLVHRMAGGQARREGDIGFAVVRGGDLVGEHTVLFAGPGEQVTLGHRAADRGVFARGALDAAVWLARHPPGLYSMRDVLLKQ